MAIKPMGVSNELVYMGGAGRLSQLNAGKALTQAPTDARLKTSYQELDDYVKMTPAQRMRVDLLQKLGLTEEDLAGMAPEERQGVETRLREMIQQQMQEAAKQQFAPKQVGQWIDTTA
jgi:hypothetical protein